MARIIIFGGQGYLGRNFIDRLRGEHQFITLGRSDMKLFNELNYEHLSIYNQALKERLNAFNADYFIVSYYGNPSSKDMDDYIELNGQIQKIYKMFSFKPKFIFLSTQLVYRAKSDASEVNMVGLVDFYGRMCVKFEKEVQEWSRGNYLILRVPIVYGGNPNLNKGYKNIVSVFLNAAIKGQNLQIYGKGTQIRSFIHIEDLILLMNKIISDNINLNLIDTCFNEHYSIIELAHFIASKFNTSCDIIDWPDSMDGVETYDIILDSTKAVSMFKNNWNLHKYLNSVND